MQTSAAGQRVRYAFIAENRLIFAVRAMCRMLLHGSEPLSPHALKDQRQTVLLKQAWDDGGEDDVYRKLHGDLRDMGEGISPNRAWRLAGLAGIRPRLVTKRTWALMEAARLSWPTTP